MVDFFGIAQTGSRGRVLVVDDEADVRKAVNLSLSRSGYEVIEADNGQTAAQVMSDGDNSLLVDVIICDIRMPHTNGVDAIANFQREYPTCPIVVLTGFPDVDLAVSLMKRGVADYIVKPVEREKLVATVDAAMRMHSRV